MTKRKYYDGTHGAKNREQRRLAVNGETHESEHVIGYKVLSGKELKRGGSAKARRVENFAPAYQETKLLHRGHIGTGTVSKTRAQAKGSAFGGSKDYRSSQRRLVLNDDTGDAVQLNQLEYASNPKFREQNDQMDKADDSFTHMIDNFQYSPSQQRSFTVIEDDGMTERKVYLTQHDAKATKLAREAARTGIWPSPNSFQKARGSNTPTWENDEPIGGLTAEQKKSCPFGLL